MGIAGRVNSLLDAFAGRVGGETKPAAAVRDPKHRFGPGLRGWPSGRRGWAYRAQARNPEVPEFLVVLNTRQDKAPRLDLDTVNWCRIQKSNL